MAATINVRSDAAYPTQSHPSSLSRCPKEVIKMIAGQLENDLVTALNLSIVSRRIASIMNVESFWKRISLHLGYGRSTGHREDGVTWRQIASAVVKHKTHCFVCLLVFDKQTETAAKRSTIRHPTLIAGLKYDERDQRKFLGWSRTTALPLISMVGSTSIPVDACLSPTLQRIADYQGSAKPPYMVGANDKTSPVWRDRLDAHITISSLLITTSPITKAAISANSKYVRLFIGSYFDPLLVEMVSTTALNPDGLTILDLVLSATFAATHRTGRSGKVEEAPLPFQGIRLVHNATSTCQDRHTTQQAELGGSIQGTEPPAFEATGLQGHTAASTSDADKESICEPVHKVIFVYGGV